MATTIFSRGPVNFSTAGAAVALVFFEGGVSVCAKAETRASAAPDSTVTLRNKTIILIAPRHW
ncbi:hypothetical protein ACEN8I_12020 [Polaromonas sp. CT11-55]|uniref:hypothetical protein n=1 Tax=Polaromonas sp. CT11-55 TaxID=3243045 RepID=UPI0039A6D85F